MDNSRKTLMMALLRTRKEWEKHMRKCALEVGIPESYRPVIMYLSRHPGANQKALAEFSNKTTAAVNQTVKEMQTKEYIRMETDEGDRRYTRLYLTDKGHEKSELLRKRLHKSDGVITEMIGKEKEDEIVALLNEVYIIIREGL